MPIPDSPETPAALSLLLVEDNPGDAKLVRYALSQANNTFDVEWCVTLKEALEHIQHETYDVVMLDLTLPDSRGLETVSTLLEAAPTLPVLVMSGMQDRSLALEAVRLGAQDYLTKGEADGPTMERAIHHAIERERAQRALTSSETRYRSIAENQKDALLLLDEHGEVTYANPAAEALLDYEQDALVGVRVLDILPGIAANQESPETTPRGDGAAPLPTPPGLAPSALRAMAGRLHVAAVTDTGMRQIPVECTVATWREEDHDCFMVVMRDLRERQRAEMILAEQRRMLARAQELAHVGSWTMDGPHGVLHGSSEFNRILGFPPHRGPLPFTEFYAMIDPADAETWVAAMERLADHGESVDLEVNMRRGDGTQRVLRIRAERTPWRDDGADEPTLGEATCPTAPRLLGSAMDITDQKEAQASLAESARQLHQSEKLAALGTLIAGVAHEINNPLAFVKSNERLVGILVERILEPLRDTDGHGLTQEQEVAVEKMHKLLATNLQGIDRIEAIVRSLRQVARPSTGERLAHDLVEVVRDTMPVLEPVRRERDTHIEVVVPEVEVPVKVNATEISQVVLNLVKNAMEASPPGARVEVHVEQLPDGGARVSVLDEGHGISDEDRLQILNPFFTTKATGTGLGLPICAKVAESHGGGLHFSNRPQGGAQFVLELPSPAMAPTVESSAAAQQPVVDARVLRGGTVR